DGALLALTLDTENRAGNAVQLYDPVTGTLRVLDSSRERYTGLAWRDGARDIAVLRTEPDTAFRDTAHILIAWTRVNTAEAKRVTLQARRTDGFPPGMRISAAHTPAWTEDGSVITVGLRQHVPARTIAARTAGDSAFAGEGNGATSDVQVWHARDERIIPEQKAQEQQDLRRTFLAAWHPAEDRLVRIGTNLMESARLLDGGRHAIETDGSRNTFGAMFGRPGVDIWLIDVATGERERVLDNVPYFHGGSETGRYLMW